MTVSGSLRSSMCAGKVSFGTWKEADRAMRSVIRLSGGKGDAPMAVYCCRYCQMFHFGHGKRSFGRKS